MVIPMLEVMDLHHSYGSTVALERVSFTVQQGEIFGLLGPNGAGKTTLLSIVSCLLQPTAGQVMIAGHSLLSGDRTLRHLIGIVPQELAIYGELTARENLHFFGELYDLKKEELRSRAEEVLAAVALEDRADSRVDTFSGGMKRRLNLGAALIHRPKLLLLDEPTTGVDPQSRNYIFEEIRRLNAAGMTVVYTSHYMEEVQALCKRVGIIDHGRLIACDTIPVLLRHLGGLIRFRLTDLAPGLRERLKKLPDTSLTECGPQGVEIECGDVKKTLLQLMTALSELSVEVLGLETHEPNLERVFLHLTGRALRD